MTYPPTFIQVSGGSEAKGVLHACASKWLVRPATLNITIKGAGAEYVAA
jgi:hypothetical protein